MRKIVIILILVSTALSFSHYFRQIFVDDYNSVELNFIESFSITKFRYGDSSSSIIDTLKDLKVSKSKISQYSDKFIISPKVSIAFYRSLLSLSSYKSSLSVDTVLERDIKFADIIYQNSSKLRSELSFNDLIIGYKYYINSIIRLGMTIHKLTYNISLQDLTTGQKRSLSFNQYNPLIAMDVIIPLARKRLNLYSYFEYGMNNTNSMQFGLKYISISHNIFFSISKKISYLHLNENNFDVENSYDGFIISCGVYF